MGDPIRAVEILGPDIRSVHVKDARRPKASGQWGEEVPLGEGEVDIKRFVQALKKIGYTGPLIVEREVGDQAGPPAGRRTRPRLPARVPRRLSRSLRQWTQCGRGRRARGPNSESQGVVRDLRWRESRNVSERSISGRPNSRPGRAGARHRSGRRNCVCPARRGSINRPWRSRARWWLTAGWLWVPRSEHSSVTFRSFSLKSMST